MSGTAAEEKWVPHLDLYMYLLCIQIVSDQMEIKANMLMGSYRLLQTETVEQHMDHWLICLPVDYDNIREG